MQRVTVKSLMRKYPHPTLEPITTGYCIGGAVCLEVERLDPDTENMDKRFPTEEHLAEVLEEISDVSGEFDALSTAREVIKHNDAGHFDFAWDALLDAIPAE